MPNQSDDDLRDMALQDMRQKMKDRFNKIRLDAAASWQTEADNPNNTDTWRDFCTKCAQQWRDAVTT